MKTSLIMTVYNRPRHLQAALAALALQSGGLELEIVVADDGSDPEQLQDISSVVEASCVPCRLVRRKRDGFRLAAARNDAVRNSSGDYLFFLDCDIALLPGAVATHLAHSREGLFLVGHRGLAGERETATLMAQGITLAGLEAAWSSADKTEMEKAARRFAVNQWLRRLGVAKRHKPKIIGCHFSLPRSAFERVNGFDERYVGWGLEDDDLAMRLYGAGVRSKSLIREARALHLWHPTLQPDSTRGFSSPNMDYFNRAQVPFRCSMGLVKEAGT